MAQFVEMIVRLVDDLDGGPGDESIEFGWDGKQYVIDLSTANANEFRAAIRPYVTGARASKTVKPKGKSAKDSLEKQARDEIREWGRANGFHVAQFSRIPRKVIEAYELALGGESKCKAAQRNTTKTT